MLLRITVVGVLDVQARAAGWRELQRLEPKERCPRRLAVVSVGAGTLTRDVTVRAMCDLCTALDSMFVVGGQQYSCSYTPDTDGVVSVGNTQRPPVALVLLLTMHVCRRDVDSSKASRLA